MKGTVKFNDGGYPIESEVVRMSVLPKNYERRRLLSAYETIQTIIAFGMFTIALISLVVKLLKNDKKK
ncbi:putative holin-like toxin [Enterococcus gallinarum]|uniref:Holin-like toxin n=1 Tax=Enterococcus gallinarum TaxID=1353 RepID=A0AAE4HSX0_ENTGA|nr:putative holin-like toxin [Enterococcus gallinarum]